MINSILSEFPVVLQDSHDAALKVMQEGEIELNILNIITYPFVWATTWFWRTTGLQAGWRAAVTIIQGGSLMFLLANRDMLAGLELSVLPVLGTVWYAL